MPIYVYECADCLGEWKESHGMHEDSEGCHWCDGSNIKRIPSFFSTSLDKKKEKAAKAGDLTKEFIENSKKDLKLQKQELNKDR